MLWNLIKSAFNFLFGRRSLQETISDLGPVYIKLAQTATTRPDIFGTWLTNRLESLQDHVPAQPIEFNGTHLSDPIAAGSIAQIYNYSDDQVIKIKRPGIDQAINRDIVSLQRIINSRIYQTISRYIPFLYNSGKVVEMVASRMFYHLDFKSEVENMRHFRSLGLAIIPEVYQYSHDHIIMEKIDGLPLHELTDPLPAVRNLAHRVCEMIFVHHLVHGDLHEGNILVVDNSKIAFLDFAIIHRITPQQAILLQIFFRCIIKQEYAILSQYMNFDVRQLVGLTDLYQILSTIIKISLERGVPLEESLLQPIVALLQVDGICRRYGYKLLDSLSELRSLRDALRESTNPN